MFYPYLHKWMGVLDYLLSWTAVGTLTQDFVWTYFPKDHSVIQTVSVCALENADCTDPGGIYFTDKLTN